MLLAEDGWFDEWFGNLDLELGLGLGLGWVHIPSLPSARIPVKLEDSQVRGVWVSGLLLQIK